MWDGGHWGSWLHLTIIVIGALRGHQNILFLLIVMSLNDAWINRSNILLPIENRVHKFRVIVKHGETLLWVIQDSRDVLIDLIPKHYVGVQLVDISTVVLLVSLGLPRRIAFHLIVLSACSWMLLLFSRALQGHRVIFKGSLSLDQDGPGWWRVITVSVCVIGISEGDLVAVEGVRLLKGGASICWLCCDRAVNSPWRDWGLSFGLDERQAWGPCLRGLT